MSFAFRAINESGYTQVDENSESFLVIETGTKAAGAAYVSLSTAYPSDILVFGRPSGGRTSGTFTMSGHLMDYTLTNGTRILRAYMNYQTAMDYVVVKRSSQFSVSDTGFGFNIYRANGDLAYTAGEKMFRVVAARAITITTSSGVFDSSWYHGSTGSIDSMYVMLGPYQDYKYRQYSSGNEKFYLYYRRRAYFDYNNHTMGTKQVADGGDLSSSASTYTRVNTGQRTEIIGYVI